MRTVVKRPNRTAQRKKADDLFRDRVRARGYCQAQGFDGIACNGALQTMHLVPRRYLSVRWDDDNAAAGCGAHHTYLTYFPLAHERFCTGFMGPNAFDALKKRAEAARGAPDYEAILQRLVEAA